MLDIALNKLPRGRPQQMLARDIGCRHIQSHDILKLIAKPIGPAHLIECRPCPDAAHQRLIEHPSIQEDIRRALRRMDLYDTQQVIPSAGNLTQERVHVRPTITLEQQTSLFPPRCLANEPDDLRTFACFQANRQ